MLVRIKGYQDRLRSSLFFVPMFLALIGLGLGQVALAVDERVGDIPVGLTATVDSARSVLGVVASATISFAGIAFSVSLLLISLSSSQYSPRVVHGLFRDPFNKRVMGVVIGTFTYCLVVLRAVRGPLEQGGQPVVPSISIALALLLGVITILSIVGFINHSAHSMDVSKILHQVTEESIAPLRDKRRDRPDGTTEHELDDDDDDDGEGFVVAFNRHGWVQQVDRAALLGALEPNSVMRFDTVAGRYAITDTPMARISPEPDDPEQVSRRVLAALAIGETRTAQDDPSYGIRQLADVALKALSPGINDPTTAQDAMFHLGTVLRELLVRDAPPRQLEGSDGRVLLLPQDFTHEEAIGLAFDETRLASAGQPTVQIYLLEILHLLSISLADKVPVETIRALARQADLILEVNELADLPRPDIERVRKAHRSRFAS